MKKKRNYLGFVCLMLLILANPAIAAEEAQVILKITPEALGSLSDKSVDDLCKAATVVWANVPSPENANSLAVVCAASIDRRKSEGKRPLQGSQPKP
jgi:hypothetical protein